MNNSFLSTKRFKNYSDYLLPIISIFIVFILIPIQIIPTIQKITSQNEEIRIGTVKKDQMQKKLVILTSENLDTLQSMLNKVNQAIPSSKEIPSIFSSINSLALSTSVEINEITVNVGEVTSSSKSSSLPTASNNSIDFQTSVSGSFLQIKGFLAQLEKTNRLFRIRSVTFSSQEKSGVSTNTANFNLMAYFQTLPSSIGKFEDPISSLSLQEKNNIGVLAEAISSQDGKLPILPMGKPNPFSRF